MQIEFSNIKLIIWDLDNTFWDGIISEVRIIPKSENIALIKDLTDIGVINSICSKNNFHTCEVKLRELNIFDYFVFPSITWESKGNRIKSIIEDMSLRSENVLFIDDDVTNLGEAQFYLPNLMIAEPDIIPDLINYVAKKKKTDLEHKRLNQYKVLETKNIEQKKYSNNEEFLYASSIHVTINTDCEIQIERLYDLLQRSNQLNYTKLRPTQVELIDTLRDKNISSAYVEVKDKFGDYGIVGFYSIENNKLKHFTFSCRTIGLGVEQYVYSQLNWPEFNQVGDVITKLEKTPAPLWINNTKAEHTNDSSDQEKSTELKVLMKGPCDLSRTMTYIKNSDRFTYEFTYVNESRNNIIEAHNHSVHIVGLKKYSESEKNVLANDCPFIDRKMLDGSIFSNEYNLIFISTLIESNFGIYRKKGTELEIAFGSYLKPLTDENNWNEYISGTTFTANNQFSRAFLESFKKNYEFIGKTKPYVYINKLRYILQNTDNKTIIALILGVEFPCFNETEGDYKERHISHIEINNEIRKFAITNSRIRIIDLNTIVRNQDDFTDNINHFTTKVYYDLSLRITEIINENSKVKIENYNSTYVFLDRIIYFFKATIKKLLPNNNFFYTKLKSVYKTIARRKN